MTPFAAMRLRKPGAGGGNPVAPFSEVQLLLHGDGLDGGTVFTDSSGAARTATKVGTITTSTTAPAIGSASIAFSGTCRLHFPQATSLDLGANDFTIQMRVKWNSLPSSGAPGTLIAKWIGTGAAQRQYFINAQFSTTNQFQFYYTQSNSQTSIAWSTGSITTGVWYLLEWCRVGTTLHFFINGVRISPITGETITGALDAVSGVTSVGGNVVSGTTFESHPGNIDELRLVIGTGLYTATHTPDTAAYPDS